MIIKLIEHLQNAFNYAGNIEGLGETPLRRTKLAQELGSIQAIVEHLCDTSVIDKAIIHEQYKKFITSDLEKALEVSKAEVAEYHARAKRAEAELYNLKADLARLSK